MYGLGLAGGGARTLLGAPSATDGWWPVVMSTDATLVSTGAKARQQVSGLDGRIASRPQAAADRAEGGA